MSDNALQNIGQTNAENSAEHRTVEAPLIPLTDAEKLDYLYQVAVKVGVLVDSISPAQVEQVKRIQTNPLISKLFAGIVKS